MKSGKITKEGHFCLACKRPLKLGEEINISMGYPQHKIPCPTIRNKEIERAMGLPMQSQERLSLYRRLLSEPILA